MTAEPMIRAGAAAGLEEALSLAGLDAADVLTSVGLAVDALADPDADVPLRRFVALLERAAADARDPDFGLALGLASQPKDLGVLGYVLQHSPTIGGAIGAVVRYLGLHQDGARIAVERDQDEARVTYQIVDPSVSPRRQDAELSVGVAVATLRSIFGAGFAPREVWFEHGEPAESGRPVRLLGCPVRYSRPTNAVVIAAALLDHPIPAPDAQLLGILSRHADERLRERGHATSIRAQVRSIVAEHLQDGVPTIDIVGRALGMSASSLRRRLKAEDSTFSAEVDATRDAMARRYLDDHALSLTEVAFLLGYSEASAFTRAFRRWTGTTPRAYRRV